MALKTETRVIVDQSPMNDLLRINFNMTFTRMSCEHLTLDISDSLGSVRFSSHGNRHSVLMAVKLLLMQQALSAWPLDQTFCKKACGQWHHPRISSEWWWAIR